MRVSIPFIDIASTVIGWNPRNGVGFIRGTKRRRSMSVQLAARKEDFTDSVAVIVSNTRVAGTPTIIHFIRGTLSPVYRATAFRGT